MIAMQSLGPAIREGLQKGLRGTLWMLKILVPCSLLTFLIDVSGLLNHLDFMLAPAMGFLDLPPEAALPLTVGLLAGIYGAVAALAVLLYIVVVTRALRRAGDHLYRGDPDAFLAELDRQRWCVGRRW